MNALNDDNFESILSGETPVPPEMGDDAALKERLATHRAIKSRLCKAFADVKPDAAFAERLRRTLASADPPKPAPREHPRREPGIRLRLWSLVAAAAVVVLVAVPLGVLWLSPEEAMAAQKEFARLHALHERPDAALFSDADPARMAAHLQQEVGFEARVGDLAPGETLRGCCVDRFNGQKVASYVLKTPSGAVSIFVSKAAPDDLRLGHRSERQGRTLWECHYGDCRIAGVSSHGVFYYAVGEVSPEALAEILLRVAPADESLS